MTAILSDAELVKLFHLGWTDSQIAKQYGVTPQAVNQKLHAMGLERRPYSNRVSRMLRDVWQMKEVGVAPDHHTNQQYRTLRTYLRLMLGDPGISLSERRRVDGWVRRLRAKDIVLCYNPDVTGGFYYRKREPRDGRRVIDWPEGVPLPEDPDLRKAIELPEDENLSFEELKKRQQDTSKLATR